MSSSLKSHTVEKADTLDYDIGNLCAYDYSSLEKDTVQEDNLLAYSRDNVQLLMNKIFALPTEEIKEEMGRLAILPEPSTALPREKPIPKAKELTKWEQFAKTKGIQKRKRGRMIFDEEKGEWAPRWGYKRANDESQMSVIEHKEGDDPSIDPWTKLAQEKKERVEKNKKQQVRNVLRGAEGKRLPGTIDLTSAVDSARTEGSRKSKKQKTDKHHVDVALSVAQKSTASLGKFDKHRESEPEMKERPQKVSAEVQRSAKAEKEQSMKVLNRLLGKETESEKINLDRLAGQAQQSQQRIQKSSKKGGSKKKK